MKAARTLLALAVLGLAQAAVADWDASMPHKMHFPQLPDPYGWDVDVTHFTLADDFRCRESGSVNDIHFWYSWKGDVVGKITSIKASLHADIPATANPYGNWSMPGPQLWVRNFAEDEFVIAGPRYGHQGWDNPKPRTNSLPDDHNTYYQANITDIPDPYAQKDGRIYWLDLTVTVESATGTGTPVLGWKTTQNIWNDSAVYYVGPGDAVLPPRWDPIAICSLDEPTDLAFVITPEPVTLGLLGLGSAMVLIRRRRR